MVYVLDFWNGQNVERPKVKSSNINTSIAINKQIYAIHPIQCHKKHLIVGKYLNIVLMLSKVKGLLF